MEKTAKMTKATAFAIALELVENSTLENKAEVAAKISKEIENIQKKNGSASGKPTKTQLENAATAHEMAEWMEAGVEYSITDLSKTCPAVLGFNPQKIRPMLTTLIKEGVVERKEGKGGKPLFIKVEEE